MTAPSRTRLSAGSLTLVILVAAILVAANVVAQRWFLRLDLTEDRRYTIAPATRKVLEGLDDVVNVDAWFSRDLPPYLTTMRREVEDMLDDYRAYAGGNLNVEFKDPGDDPVARQRMGSLGIPEVQLEILEKDQFQITNAYMGIALHFAGRKEVIPVVQNTARLEYELTSALLRLTRPEKSAVGWMRPPAEGDHFRTGGNPLVEELRRFYDVREIAAGGLREIPAEVDTLLLAAPEGLDDAARFAIDQFVMRGGRLIALVDHFSMPGGGLFTAPLESGVHDLLEHYGVRVNRDVVVEPFHHARASFSSGFMQFRIPYPFWPTVARKSLDAGHPVTAALDSLVLPWASSLEIVAAEGGGAAAEVLASSSPESWTESEPYDFSPQRRLVPPAKGDRGGSRPLAVLLTGRFRSFWEGKEPPAGEGEEPKAAKAESPETSILVVGTSRLASPEFLQQFPVDGVFLLNAVDWMTFGSDLIGIRSRTSGEKGLPEISERAKKAIKTGNTVAFPALLALFGFVYLAARRRRRHAR